MDSGAKADTQEIFLVGFLAAAAQLLASWNYIRGVAFGGGHTSFCVRTHLGVTL